jgi:hypothetical protein
MGCLTKPSPIYPWFPSLSISDANVGKTMRGTSGWAKGLIFKVLVVHADSVLIHTYAGDRLIPIADFRDIDADEIGMV